MSNEVWLAGWLTEWFVDLIVNWKSVARWSGELIQNRKTLGMQRIPKIC